MDSLVWCASRSTNTGGLDGYFEGESIDQAVAHIRKNGFTQVRWSLYLLQLRDGIIGWVCVNHYSSCSEAKAAAFSMACKQRARRLASALVRDGVR